MLTGGLRSVLLRSRINFLAYVKANWLGKTQSGHIFCAKKCTAKDIASTLLEPILVSSKGKQ